MAMGPSYSTGRAIRKIVPLFIADSMVIYPPWFLMICRERLKPIPDPSDFVDKEIGASPGIKPRVEGWTQGILQPT